MTSVDLIIDHDEMERDQATWVTLKYSNLKQVYILFDVDSLGRAAITEKCNLSNAMSVLMNRRA